jgi:hypothetical protein
MTKKEKRSETVRYWLEKTEESLAARKYPFSFLGRN